MAFTLNQVHSFASSGDLESLSKVTPLSLLSKADVTGVTALHVAAANGQAAVIEWLVSDESRDDEVNKVDEDARTPLHWAAWNGKSETARTLLEVGAIRDKVTRTGFTPLHYACFIGSLDTVKVLVEFGAKYDAKDESQQTPYDVAIRFDHPEVANYLKEEAPAISVEARKKHVTYNDESRVFIDPAVAMIQRNEDMNLERIVKTATKVAADNKGFTYGSGAVDRPRQRQRNLMFGIFVFTATFVLGVAIGKRSKA